MISLRFAMVGAFAVLASCGPTPAEQRAMDQQKCGGYGFAPGSDAFADCMMKVTQQREAEQAADRRASADRDAAQQRQRDAEQAAQARSAAQSSSTSSSSVSSFSSPSSSAGSSPSDAVKRDSDSISDAIDRDRRKLEGN